ncbi:MAG: cadmium-translocating P-type ATPase [Candidatus Pacebacteria bacterium]|nr:cadmium-translocating P-type ATPase [Candidatus Paceibacterota bacterium]
MDTQELSQNGYHSSTENEPTNQTLSIAEKIYKEIEEERREVKQNAILTLVTLIGLLVGTYFQLSDTSALYVAIAFVIAYMAGGIPAAKGAFESLFEKKLDIDLLMVLAALAAAGVGEARDGAILLFLFSLAGTLEGYAMGNTKRAVASLMKLRPDEANVLNFDGTTTRVMVEALSIGQKVIVRPGERLPVDGVIAEGAGAIDQSSVTGESVPVDKELGDTVFAGTVNQNAVLTVEVTKTAEQSTIARMIQLVTEAQEKRSPSEQFSDWFGERYTYIVLFGSIASLGIFLLFGLPTDEALYKAATLLVVASPCAIVISVPAAILSAIASAARSGALFKGGAAIEQFGSVDIVAFDKTGTLTHGKMQVTEIVSVSSLSATEVLALATSLETHSEHPVAASIRNYAIEAKVQVKEANNISALIGRGITATIANRSFWAGNRTLMKERGISLDSEAEATIGALESAGMTTVLVGDDTSVLGAIAVADTIRASAQISLEALRKQGVKKFVMLTGDTEAVAKNIAAQVGIAPENVFAGLLPEQKVQIIEELRTQGTVAFIGDGVNDAAALATSHVGVAMGVGGSDVALEAADVALLSDDLTKLAKSHQLSRSTNTIIRQNLFFAVGIMGIMVVTTIFYHLPLPLGVIGHEGGTLIVVANGLRLLFKKV